MAEAYHENALHARGLVASVFANAIRDGQLRPADASFLAEQFSTRSSTAPSAPWVLSGKIAKSEKELRERVVSAVDLFLNGCRDHSARRG